MMLRFRITNDANQVIAYCKQEADTFRIIDSASVAVRDWPWFLLMKNRELNGYDTIGLCMLVFIERGYHIVPGWGTDDPGWDTDD